MKKYIVVVMLLSTAVLALGQSSSTCTGTINFLGVGSNGVAVGLASGPQGPGLTTIFVCNLNTTGSNGYSPDVCKATYAMLLAAQLSGQAVTIEFADTAACTRTAWTAPATLEFVALASQ